MTVVGFLAMMTRPLAAQRIDRRYDAPTVDFLRQPRPSLARAAEDRSGRKILGGTVGAVIGMALGAGAGAAIERASYRNSCYEDCGLAGALLGGLIGEALFFGAGIHLADPDPERTTGRFLYPALVSAGGIVGSLMLSNPLPLLFVIPVQFAVTW
ncbi:MAG: hypothetical protein V4503_02085 [Gemmatimonadota bacterium]